MAEHQRAYNSLWQVRGDSWCRLDEAADRLARPTTAGALKDKYAGICRDLLLRLTPLEPYWAYPGAPQFGRLQRLFAAGSYDKFAAAVARTNRALTTESYRSGDVDNAGADELDMFPADPRQLENQPPAQRERPYFEVLVVEKMTEAQERALRQEVRALSQLVTLSLLKQDSVSERLKGVSYGRLAGTADDVLAFKSAKA